MNLTLSPKAKQVVATVAPLLGTAVGGPWGAVVGGLISKALGTPSGDSKAAEAALAGATPEQLTALSQAQIALRQHMADLGVQEEQLAYQDTASARAREIAVKDWTPRIIAIVVIAATFALEGSLLLGWHYPTKVSGEVLGRILGTLDSAAILVLSYYFGSSVGARNSADALADIAKQP